MATHTITNSREYILNEYVTYTGQVRSKDYKPHGYGSYVTPGGDKFEGYFSKGDPVSGKYTYSNGSYVHVSYSYNLTRSRYTKHFETSKSFGYPSYQTTSAKTYDNGKYMGGMLNGQRHGIGKYQWATGTSYVGGWKKGMYHGVGKYTYSDGDYDWRVYENDQLIATLKRYRKQEYSSSSSISYDDYSSSSDDYSYSSDDSSSSRTYKDDMFDDALKSINTDSASDALDKLNRLRSHCSSDDYYITDEMGHTYDLDEYKRILEKEVEEESADEDDDEDTY